MNEQVVPFHMKHNAESDACDLLIEVERVALILDHTDEGNYMRVCRYLTACAAYVPEPDDSVILGVVYDAFRRMERLPEAMHIALKVSGIHVFCILLV